MDDSWDAIKYTRTSLSDEERQQWQQFKQRFEQSVSTTKTDFDQQRIESAVRELYVYSEAGPPGIFWCENPFQAWMAPIIIEELLRTKLNQRIRLWLESKLNTGRWRSFWQVFDAQYEVIRRMQSVQDHSLVKPRWHHCGEPWAANLYRPLRRNWEANQLASSDLWQQLLLELQSEILTPMRNGSHFMIEEFNARQRDIFVRTVDAGIGAELRSQVSDKVQLKSLRVLKKGLSLQNAKIQPAWAGDVSRMWTYGCARRRIDEHADHGDESLWRYRAQQAVRDAFVLDVLRPDWENAPLRRRISNALYLSEHVFLAYAFENIVFLCKNPRLFRLDSSKRLHSERGPAIEFAGGFSLYAWHGTAVPQWVIENAELISVESIESEQNVEVRRVMLERFGEERYLHESCATQVDADRYGILYRKEMPDDEPLVMVRVIDATPLPDGTRKSYYLRVAPHIRTAKQAVAWTFEQEIDEYNPLEEA